MGRRYIGNVSIKGHVVTLHIALDAIQEEIPKLKPDDFGYLMNRLTELSDLCWQEIKRRREK